MHLFLRRSVYKHVCTVKVRQSFSVGTFVLSTSAAPSRASTISTLVLSVMLLGEGGRFKEERAWVLAVLCHNHCTIDSRRLSSSSVFPLTVRSFNLTHRSSCSPTGAALVCITVSPRPLPYPPSDPPLSQRLHRERSRPTKTCLWSSSVQVFALFPVASYCASGFSIGRRPSALAGCPPSPTVSTAKARLVGVGGRRHVSS